MKIKLQPSGKEFEAASDQSILDAALHHGVNVPYGCRSGFCGDCKGRVAQGEFLYPQDIPEQTLTEEERANGMALLCQAHAQGDMEIEIRTVDTPEGIEIRKFPARVAEMDKLAHDVIRLKSRRTTQRVGSASTRLSKESMFRWTWRL